MLRRRIHVILVFTLVIGLPFKEVLAGGIFTRKSAQKGQNRSLSNLFGSKTRVHPELPQRKDSMPRQGAFSRQGSMKTVSGPDPQGKEVEQQIKNFQRNLPQHLQTQEVPRAFSQSVPGDPQAVQNEVQLRKQRFIERHQSPEEAEFKAKRSEIRQRLEAQTPGLK